MAKKPVIVSSNPRAPAALGRRRLYALQDRIRDPILTVLLVLELCAMFLAAPLAAKGLPIARVVSYTLVLGFLIIVVMLTQRWGAIILILLGVRPSQRAYC